MLDQIVQQVPGGWATVASVSTAVFWWLFSTLAAELPVPLATERWYGFVYRVVQRIAANHVHASTALPQNAAQAQGK